MGLKTVIWNVLPNDTAVPPPNAPIAPGVTWTLANAIGVFQRIVSQGDADKVDLLSYYPKTGK